MTGNNQPLTGILSTAATIAFSLILISLFSFPLFAGWVSYALLCLIPMQIVIAVAWGCKHPRFAASRKQPAKGMLLILITAAAAAVVAPLYFTIVGGGVAPPAPMLMQCTIVSVVVMFWLAVMWGGWPFNVAIRNPVAAGFAMLAGAYVLNAVLFRVFFDYGFMRDAPVYVPSLDPQGLFNAWSALVFYVTALAAMFLMLHFDLWPLTKSPSVMRQPLLGFVWTALVLLIGAALFLIGTRVAGMDPVAFLVRIPVPFIFGTIVVLNMLQNSLFRNLAQPAKGIANTVTAAIVGIALAQLYAMLRETVTAPLAGGPPAYEAEIWLASALLSVTFPFLIFHAEFLNFWPIRRQD